LEDYVGGKALVCSGFRVGDGFEKESRGPRKQEYVLFTAWDNVERHLGFAETEGFKKYRTIMDHVDSAEIRHAVRLSVG
jgi:hypothetical protein